MIYLIWGILIALEVWRNWYKIEKKKQNINHKGATLLRLLVGFAVFFLYPIFYKLPADRLWAMPIMMGMTFMCFFDWGLNLARGRSFFYLGDGAWLDRFQKKTFGAWPWFWWKLILCIGSIALFEYGFSIYWE